MGGSVHAGDAPDGAVLAVCACRDLGISICPGRRDPARVECGWRSTRGEVRRGLFGEDTALRLGQNADAVLL